MKKNIIKENFSKVQGMIDDFYSKNNSADIIFLPEVWTTGWYCPIFKDLAEDTKNTENFLIGLSKKYNVNIVGGSFIKKEGKRGKNTCLCIDRKGNIIAKYEKIHLYSPDGEAEFVDSGDTPVIVDIEGLKIGLSICYDIRFPELYRSYINTEFPPQLMVNMSAWPKTRRNQYKIMASSRAIENQCYFLALSQCGEIKDSIYNSGCSLLVDSMGNTIKELDENEGYLYETIDTATVDLTRNTYPNLKNRKVNNFGFNAIIKKGVLLV